MAKRVGAVVSPRNENERANSVKKILIVTRYFYPDITPRAFRAFELAKELSRQGHNVEVLTVNRDFDYCSLEKEFGIAVKAVVKKEPAKMQGKGLSKILGYALQWLFYYPFILLAHSFSKKLSLQSSSDLLISIAHPYSIHIAVALALRNNRNLCGTWVADCGDPFVNEGARKLPAPFYFVWLEKWLLSRPDFVTIPIEEAKPAYPKSCAKKLMIIPQGFDFSAVEPSYDHELNKCPTFAYAGMLSAGSRDPRKFLDYLCELDKDFRFLVYTKNKSLLVPYEKVLGGKLEIMAYVPRKKLLADLGAMDFLINFENSSCVQKPSKIIDYALVRRPILSIEPWNIEKNVINEFMNGCYERQLHIENLEQFDIRNVAEKFVSLAQDRESQR